jgi:DNA polymerase
MSAEPFVPATKSVPALRKAAKECRGCPLFAPATQTVFGEGPSRAALMLVGEQPGDVEDIEGHPFVGPAGRILARALDAAGVSRASVYLTNAVKHFKFEERGKRRIHKRPATSEINACSPWLRAEIAATRPRVIVCLGAVASQSVFGSGFQLMKQRGRVLESPLAPAVIATLHPSALLRMPDAEAREAAYDLLVKDLKLAAKKGTA